MKIIKLIFYSVMLLSSSSCSGLESKFCSKNCKQDNNLQVQSVSNLGPMETDSSKVGALDDDNLLCTLKGAEQAERKEKLQNEIFSKAKEVEEIESGYIFNFEYEEKFIMKMTDYILAENSCCPFFQFDIKLKSKNDVVLKITGPPQAKSLIKMALIDDF